MDQNSPQKDQGQKRNGCKRNKQPVFTGKPDIEQKTGSEQKTCRESSQPPWKGPEKAGTESTKINACGLFSGELIPDKKCCAMTKSSQRRPQGKDRKAGKEK